GERPTAQQRVPEHRLGAPSEVEYGDEGRHYTRYLFFFSRVPVMSNSCFCPPNSAEPFPVSLSPSIISAYSMGMTLSMNFRTTENVSFPSLNFGSAIFSSFWSGQFMVPSILSPSLLIVSSAVRFWSPIEYWHFHVPTGSAFSPCALVIAHNPSISAAERIVFIAPPRSNGPKLSHYDA